MSGRCAGRRDASPVTRTDAALRRFVAQTENTVPGPIPGPKARATMRRQVSWLAGRRGDARLPGLLVQWLVPLAFPFEGLRVSLCIALAAYSCRDSRGVGR